MTVNLTRIYTKLGDGGETHLGDMSRVSKLHPRVEAYGTVDELNATLGLALLAPGLPGKVRGWLERVQNDLLDLGADLSVPDPTVSGPTVSDPTPSSPVRDGASSGLDPRAAQDPRDASPAMAQRSPGRAQREDEGSSDAAAEPAREERSRLRVSAQYTEWLEGVCDEVNATLAPLRSFVIPGGTPASAQLHVCRTVCRRAERRAIALGEAGNPEVVRYLNRLSDLLFILARACNEGAEPLWDPGAHGADAGAGAPAAP